MKILMVSSYLPYPLFSGGHIRLYNLLKELKKNHAITLICEMRSNQSEKDVSEVKKFCKEVITVPRKKQWSIENIIKSGFSTYPFLMVGHTNDSLKRSIDKVLQSELFDVIHVETFYVMQNLPKLEIPVVLVEHNIEYLVYDRFLKQAPFALAPLLRLDIAKMKYWEEKFWQKANVLVAVSNEERAFMKRDDAVVVPNGVDVQKFKIQNSKFKIDKKEKRILFIGDFKWIQNRDAIEWILKEIWPRINSELDFKLWIVGKEIPDSIKKLSSNENVLFDENAPEDTSQIYHKADMLLAPVRVGGGTRYKILEAMATGCPVVTTSLGAQGLEVVDRKHLMIADSTDEIADRVLELFTNKEQYEKIAMGARQLIEEKYDWKNIAKILESVYESVAK